MDLPQIVTLLYVLTAGGAMWMTISERRLTGMTSLFHGILAMLACAVWPLTLVGMLVLRARADAGDLANRSEA